VTLSLLFPTSIIRTEAKGVNEDIREPLSPTLNACTLQSQRGPDRSLAGVFISRPSVSIDYLSAHKPVGHKPLGHKPVDYKLVGCKPVGHIEFLNFYIVQYYKRAN
jgi:hypothetical protein